MVTYRSGLLLLGAAVLALVVSDRIPRPSPYDPAPIACKAAERLHQGRIGLVNASENFPLAAQAGIFLDEEFPGPFVWDQMQSSYGAPYIFTTADDVVARAQARGFSLIGVLWPYAEWDQEAYGFGASCRGGGYSQSLPSHRCRPSNDEAYSDFVYQVVERYDGDGVYDLDGLCTPITHWEVIATPSRQQALGGVGAFRGTPIDYFNLLRVTFDTVKGSCPRCEVHYGALDGTGPASLGFLDGVLRLGGADYFDVVSLHAKSSEVAADVSRIAGLLESYHHPKPLWVTRLEADDDPSLASGIVKGMTEAFAAGAQRVYYPMITYDARVVPAQNRLAVTDAEGKPAGGYRALQTFIQKVGSWDHVEKVSPGRYRFDREGKTPLYVVWDAGDGRTSAADTVSGELRVSTLDGTMEAKNIDEVRLTATPLYIE